MRHSEAQVQIMALPDAVFAYVDDHKQFSSHMAESSWMMGGGKMETTVDEGGGQAVGSHIRMKGRVLGFGLNLDEVITAQEPPHLKAWETVGEPALVVVGSYQMTVEVKPQGSGSLLRVAIDYELPRKRRWLGKLFGGWYARWCVRQMAGGVQAHFAGAPI